MSFQHEIEQGIVGDCLEKCLKNPCNFQVKKKREISAFFYLEIARRIEYFGTTEFNITVFYTFRFRIFTK